MIVKSMKIVYQGELVWLITTYKSTIRDGPDFEQKQLVTIEEAHRMIALQEEMYEASRD